MLGRSAALAGRPKQDKTTVAPRKNVVSRIVTAYLTQSQEHVAQLSEAATKGDASGVQNAAHTLKSSSFQVGAISLSELCAELEASGREQNVEDIGEKVIELQALYVRVCGELTSLCPQNAA